MRKEEANDIAKLLIASSGIAFDGFAFEDTDLSEHDIQKVMNSINEISYSNIEKIKKKYRLERLDISSTESIVNSILYE